MNNISLTERIFGFVWAIYCGALFMLVMTLIAPLTYVFLRIAGKKYADPLLQLFYSYLSRFFLFCWGIRCTVYHKEKSPKQGPVVIIANHRAQLDIVAGAYALNLPARFLGKAELLKIPFFGLFIRLLAIPVYRKDKSSREQSLQQMTEAVKNGGAVFIYPEGTRNRDAASVPLQPFKDGAFRVAIASGAPIMVQVLEHTDRLNNPNFLHLIPGKVSITWLGPYPSTGMNPEHIEEWKEKIRRDILTTLNQKKSLLST